MTPHIEAKKSDIASVVIMPGDPNRAKFIAENYLTDYRLVNEVRGELAYTGFYKNKEVTVMSSGMGMPSMGIYSYELFNTYEVDTIIRVGSFGAYTSDINVYDLLLVAESYSDTNFDVATTGVNNDILLPSIELNDKIKDTAKRLNFDLKEGKIYSSDAFYTEESKISLYETEGCLGVEMESFALFQNAKTLNKKAACILTCSDNLVTKVETTSEERETAFTKMMELALETIKGE